MQIEINGKRNITLDFNAPKKFRLVKDGAEIPYIRTGKNSFRLSKPVDGFVELEEIIEQPRYMQPVQLQPQQMTVINPQDVDRLNEAVRQMALVNPQDVMIINQTAEQLEQNQNFIAQTQKEITDNQVYIDQQQQRLNETALGIQALETDNSQRLDGTENAILNLAGEISNAQNMAVDGMNTALNKIEEQGILLQAEIDTKADKDELESLKKDFEEKSDQFSNAMSNYSGGTAYDTLPQGGEAGQILAKRTDRQGDYIWIDQTPVIVKSETIPTASEKYKGEVYQYVGETGDYTHGYIYECQQNGTSYNWVRLDVQPNTAVWGQITGTLSDQTDLQNALDDKQDKLSQTQMDAVNSGANQSNIAQITTNQSNINTINNKIPAQASSSNKLTDKSYVDSQDNSLQTQIDAIVASSDVFDIVGTYAELQAYDISSVPVNDIIKVLVDSTHNDAATYYRCVENSNVKSWSYIGSEGAYYTKGETNTLLSTKQDTLVSGTNIKTINSNSILGSGNLDIDALPSQTGQSGKFLTTDGTDVSWANVPARNIGEIIQSTIPLTDAGLHLLDGALISGAGSYSDFVTYMANLYSTAAKVSNINIVGTLTDNNGIISGFSTGNYAKINSPFNPSSNTWEIGLKIHTPSEWTSGYRPVLGSANEYSMGLQFYTGTGKLATYLSSNGSSWDISGYDSSVTALSTNTDYWIKLTFDGTQYVTSISTDGENYTAYQTTTSSTPIIPSTNKVLGTGRTLTSSFLGGSIDLNECYIDIDGSRHWTGMQPECFTDEAQWQQSVTDYGVCGKFVYDSVNNTVRLPKYSNKIYTSAIATTAGVKGNGKTLGLTDGTTTAGLNGNRYVSSTHYGLTSTMSAGTAVGTTGAGTGALANNVFAGITTDATKSGIIADLSNITTALDGYYYIVIANSTKTNIEVDIDEVMTDLNGKADVDLSNVNASGTSLASGWALPSSRYISLAWGASGSTYTAPANGCFYARARSKGTTKTTYISLFNETTLLVSSGSVYLNNTSAQYTVHAYIPVRKGETVSLAYDLASTVDNNVIRFIYAEGEPNV